MSRHPVIVVGPGRSGTSAVARVLHERLGVSMGDRLHPADQHNPLGYYEDERLIGWNEGLTRKRLAPDAWDRLIGRWLAQRQAAGCAWGFKSTRLPHLWRRFGRHLDLGRCTFVRTRRPEADVVASWVRCYEFDALAARATVRYRERELDELQAATPGALWLDVDTTERRTDEDLVEVLSSVLPLELALAEAGGR